MELIITDKELEQLEKNEVAIRTNLVSKALYNESLKYEFTEEDLKNIWFNEENLVLELYMRKKVEPRVMVTEDSIIEEYNANKEIFENNKMSFEESRNYIINRLTNIVNEGLFEDLVKKLMNEMSDKVELSKEDVLFTKGDPNLIKAILLISVLRENAKKDNFFEENKEEIELLKKDARLNYYFSKLLEKEAVIPNEEILNNMQEITKNNFELVKDLSQEDLYRQVGSSMLNKKIEEVKNSIINRVVKENNIDELVKGYLEK